MQTSRVVLLISVIGLLCSGGCGQNQIAKVTGRVTYDGKPVTFGTVAFVHTSGKTAFGEIQPDGTYALTTEKESGAYIGDHIVTITALKLKEAPKDAGSEGSDSKKKGGTSKGAGARPMALPKPEDFLVPQSYSNTKTTTLKAKVEDKQNEINFDISKE